MVKVASLKFSYSTLLIARFDPVGIVKSEGPAAMLGFNTIPALG